MAIAINPKQTVPYILKADRASPPEKQTTWHFRALTLDEQAQIRDSVLTQNAETNEVIVRGGRAELTTLRLGLTSVDNFLDESGKPLKIEKVNGLVPDELLERVSPADRAELAQAIARRGHVTSAEGN